MLHTTQKQNNANEWNAKRLFHGKISNKHSPSAFISNTFLVVSDIFSVGLQTIYKGDHYTNKTI